MNRTVFSLPEHSEYRTHGGLAVMRSAEQFSGGANRLDELIELLDQEIRNRRGAAHDLQKFRQILDVARPR